MSTEVWGKSRVVQVTVGAMLSLAVALLVWGWKASQKWHGAEAFDTAQQVQLDDVTERQRRYIERRDVQHDELQRRLQDLHAEIERMREWVAATHGEVIR